VRVRVRVRLRVRQREYVRVCLCVYVCAYSCLCVCMCIRVCVCVYTNTMCVCVCVYVCTRGKEGVKEIAYSARPNPKFIFHFLVARFQNIVVRIVQYKCTKSCAEVRMLQDLILRTRLCGTGFITHPGWLIHFLQINMIGWKCFAPLRYQLSKGT